MTLRLLVSFTRLNDRQDSAEVIMFIRVHKMNLTIINTGFSVQEGHKHNITAQELNVHVPAKSRNFCFNITRLPEHGNLSVSSVKSTGTGERYFVLEDLVTEQIFYQRDDKNSLSDGLEFTATALFFNESSQSMEAFQITDSTILPINNVTTTELSIPFPDNSRDITVSINRPLAPKYGNIVVSTISKTAGLYFYLKDLAIEQIFYRINNDTCDQDSFEFQARAENFDTMSQTWKPFQETDTIIVINDPPIAIRELDLSLPPNSRDLRLYITRKPVCGNITVSTAKNISGEQLHFILIEDPATERIFYQKNLHDSFEFIAVADYFNESSKSWEIFQTTDSFDMSQSFPIFVPPKRLESSSLLTSVIFASTLLSHQCMVMS